MLKNFKPVNLILVVGAMALPVSAYADLVPEKLDVSISLQSGKVTGVVEDNFGPVAGASVVVKGTTNGTITDMNGNFSLEGVNNGDLIQISFIGYMTQGAGHQRKACRGYAKTGRGSCYRLGYETLGKIPRLRHERDKRRRIER